MEKENISFQIIHIFKELPKKILLKGKAD